MGLCGTLGEQQIDSLDHSLRLLKLVRGVASAILINRNVFETIFKGVLLHKAFS